MYTRSSLDGHCALLCLIYMLFKQWARGILMLYRIIDMCIIVYAICVSCNSCYVRMIGISHKSCDFAGFFLGLVY